MTAQLLTISQVPVFKRMIRGLLVLDQRWGGSGTLRIKNPQPIRVEKNFYL